MPVPRRFTIGKLMIATAIVAILCAGVILLREAWGPLVYYLPPSLPEEFSTTWVVLMALMVFVGPFLLAGLGLYLFPIRIEPEAKVVKSPKAKPRDLCAT